MSVLAYASPFVLGWNEMPGTKPPPPPILTVLQEKAAWTGAATAASSCRARRYFIFKRCWRPWRLDERTRRLCAARRIKPRHLGAGRIDMFIGPISDQYLSTIQASRYQETNSSRHAEVAWPRHHVTRCRHPKGGRDGTGRAENKAGVGDGAFLADKMRISHK